MEAIELAALFVEAAETKKKLEEIERVITTAVLEAQETQKIAGVTATFYKPGFGTPNYAKAAESYIKANDPGMDLTDWTTTRTTVRWKDLCGVLEIEAPPGAPKPARVAIKY